jgi:arylformamidase
MKLEEPYRIIDISQPVTSHSACFPGDTPFQKKITARIEDNHSYNLSSLTMSPHVGTHADAPLHILGDMAALLVDGAIGSQSLSPFIGDTLVIDLSDWKNEITYKDVESQLEGDIPRRILFKTAKKINYDVFENEYAYISSNLVEHLVKAGIVLVGLDVPSVDQINSKSLDTHHALLKHNLAWLENLDLSQVDAGRYFLIALPIKFMELEASPVRAVLLASA